MTFPLLETKFFIPPQPGGRGVSRPLQVALTHDEGEGCRARACAGGWTRGCAGGAG